MKKTIFSIIISVSIILVSFSAIPIQKDIIYFLLIDRFADGDPSNNYGNNPNSYVPFTGENYESLKTYQGGDIKGIIDKLEYLEELGITILWISPFIDNSDTDYVGWWAYHGYHPINFYEVEEHFGTLEELKRLVDTAHKHNIKVVFDMPLNQTAADHPWLDNPQKKDWYHYGDDGKPFDITDWFDLEQSEKGELHGLPDLAQENPEVAEHLTEMSKYWIRETGCDGFRLDAVKHIPVEFWVRYNGEIKEFAGDDFLLIGEVFWGETFRMEPYKGIGFSHLFDFPGYYNIRSTFAKGGSIKTLSDNLKREFEFWQGIIPVTLLDNHDVARFNSGLNDHVWEKQLLALTYLFTMPGLPMIYYGTEIGMKGYPTVDPQTGEHQDYLNRFPMPRSFDRNQTERLKDFKTLVSLRQDNPALYSGEFYEIYKDWGTYGYLRISDEQSLLIFLNTASTNEKLATDLNAWQININPELIYGEGAIIQTGDFFDLTLPPMSSTIWVVDIIKSNYSNRWADFTDRLTGDFRMISFSYQYGEKYPDRFEIAGDFNDWTPTYYEIKISNDNIIATIPLRPGTYRYKFVLNENEWVPDPSAEIFEPDPYGGRNSIIIVE